MSKPIVYRSRQRWQFWAAFAGSILIHVGTVAAGWTKATVPPLFMPSGFEVNVTVEPAESSLPEPPPIDISLPPPQPSVEPAEFLEDRPIIPKHPRFDNVGPLVKRTPIAAVGATRMSVAKIAAITAPKPVYPYEARRQHLTGSGIAVLTVNPLTGHVTRVSMRQSTGSSILDGATISAFERWQFNPRTVSEVMTPITFTLTGAQY
ncbi:MAG TPA: TonB family protein [Chthoniobacterales bacterium]|jgi:TonB family protein